MENPLHCVCYNFDYLLNLFYKNAAFNFDEFIYEARNQRTKCVLCLRKTMIEPNVNDNGSMYSARELK